MEDYKQYLNDNADEAERRAAEQVIEGLTGLRLEFKVREVAAERAALRRRASWQRFLISVVALVLVTGAAYLFLREKAPPSVPQQQEQLSAPQANNPTSPPEKTPDKKENAPIAQLRPEERLPNPRYPAPDVTMIRGDETSNKALKAVLDPIWYTDYPLTGLKTSGPFKQADGNLKKRDFTAAYLELGRLEDQLADNDTLRYLTAYCLLEMGEGEEALTYLNPLQSRHTAWEPQLQWYRGLAFLLSGEREKALALFQKLAKQSQHPYQRQADKAAGLIR